MAMERLGYRGQSQLATRYFPGTYATFRNLCYRISEDHVETAPLPVREQVRLLDYLEAAVARRASQPDGRFLRRFTGEDALELVRPVAVMAEVAPDTWFCHNCQGYFVGDLRDLKIRQGRCPLCEQQSIIQFSSIFICPRDQDIVRVEPPSCPECRSSGNMKLDMAGGRRGEYEWYCAKHPKVRQRLARRHECGEMMVLKNAYSNLMIPDTDRTLSFIPQDGVSADAQQLGIVRQFGICDVRFGRVAVTEFVLGYRRVHDLGAYYSQQLSIPIRPFINNATRKMRVFCSHQATDGVQVVIERAMLNDLQPEEQGELVHSLKHALINVAPVLTGLAMGEYGADFDPSQGTVTLYDKGQGGKGGSRLLATTRIARWFELAQELVECRHNDCEQACRGCLFLPHTVCRTINRNLDRRLLQRVLFPQATANP